MGRLGLTQNEFVSIIRSDKVPRSLRLEGLMTHLADADGPDQDATEEQIRRFNASLKVMLECGFQVPLVHVSNSGGAVRFPSAHFTSCGPASYCTVPYSSDTVEVPDLRPVLSQNLYCSTPNHPTGGTVSYNRTFTAKCLTELPFFRSVMQEG